MARKKKSKNNFKKVGLIAGVVALGGAALYAAYSLKEKKIVVQYGHDGDKTWASLLAKKLDADLVLDPLYGWKQNFGNITKPTVFVGGQIANPAVGSLMDIGIFREVTTQNPRTIQVSELKGFPVFLVAGWDAADTKALADYVIKNGLPSSDRIVD